MDELVTTMDQLVTRLIIRNDSTVNWDANSDAVLMKGEMGVEFTSSGKVRAKFGDGVKTWAELPYFGGEEAKTFQVGSLEEITETELAKGDTAIVKTAIYVDAQDETKSKYSYTGYVYNGTDWVAMDGNYNADNVYFDEDMMVTKEIGYITLTNGQGTIPSKGKNLTGVFEAMFVKEQNPSKTDPSVSVTLTGAGSYEVGTKVTGVKYSASFEDGKYTYGPEPTGAEVTAWAVTDTNGGAYSAKSGDLADITVDDNTNFSVTAEATHTAGNTPKTNKGNDCKDSTKKIAAGTKKKTSSAIKGYRSFFYGAVTVPVKDLTSEIIRGLTNAGDYNEGKSFTIKADGATNLKAFIVAIPAGNTRSGITKVNSTAGMTVDMTESYIQGANVSVADCRGTVDGVNQNPTAYKIYAWEPASIDSGAVHEFTLG